MLLDAILLLCHFSVNFLSRATHLGVVRLEFPTCAAYAQVWLKHPPLKCLKLSHELLRWARADPRALSLTPFDKAFK